MGHKSRGSSLVRVRLITTSVVVVVAKATIMAWPCSSITTVGYRFVSSGPLGQWVWELVLVMGTELGGLVTVVGAVALGVNFGGSQGRIRC